MVRERVVLLERRDSSLIIILLIFELEKREARSIGKFKKRVDIVVALVCNGIMPFNPSSYERQPQDIFVEMPGLFQIPRDIGVVVQSLNDIACPSSRDVGAVARHAIFV
jgi:hypothetical protein